MFEYINAKYLARVCLMTINHEDGDYIYVNSERQIHWTLVGVQPLRTCVLLMHSCQLK